MSSISTIYMLRREDTGQDYRIGYPKPKVVPATYASLTIAKRQARRWALTFGRERARQKFRSDTTLGLIKMEAQEVLKSIAIDVYKLELVESVRIEI